MKSVKFTAETIQNIVATIKDAKTSCRAGRMDADRGHDAWVSVEQDGVWYTLNLVWYDTVEPETGELGSEFYIIEQEDGPVYYFVDGEDCWIDLENANEVELALPVIEGKVADLCEEAFKK